MARRKVILINFISGGGIGQFTNRLRRELTKAGVDIVYAETRSVRQLVKLCRRDVHVVFCVNNIRIYILLLLLRSFSPTLILHDHKARAGASRIEKLIILCLHLFARRFKAIIIHSPETALSALKNVVLTKMPYHSAEFPLMDRVRVLYFGRIEAYKNLRYLVGIASRTSDTTDYFIAGSGDIEPELMKQIRGSPNVSLINSYIDGRTIKLLFDWCDYLILPYSDVTQTGLVDQAGYFAKPVILSNFDGFKPYLGKKFCVALDLNNLDSATERVQKLPVRTSLEYRAMAMDSQLNYESSVGAWSDYVDLIVKIQ